MKGWDEGPEVRINMLCIMQHNVKERFCWSDTLHYILLLCVLSLTRLKRQGWEAAAYVAGNGLDEWWKWGVEVNTGQQTFGNMNGRNCFSCAFSRSSHPHNK